MSGDKSPQNSRPGPILRALFAGARTGCDDTREPSETIEANPVPPAELPAGLALAGLVLAGHGPARFADTPDQTRSVTSSGKIIVNEAFIIFTIYILCGAQKILDGRAASTYVAMHKRPVVEMLRPVACTVST